MRGIVVITLAGIAANAGEAQARFAIRTFHMRYAVESLPDHARDLLANPSHARAMSRGSICPQGYSLF